jgi:hypothetical protein
MNAGTALEIGPFIAANRSAFAAWQSKCRRCATGPTPEKASSNIALPKQLERTGGSGCDVAAELSGFGLGVLAAAVALRERNS